MRRLALASVGLALVVVVLGAYTRLADAGLGCPDWPGCYGNLGAPQNAGGVAGRRGPCIPDAPVDVGKAWIEMVHRYFATALGALILGLAVVAVRAKGGRAQGLAHRVAGLGDAAGSVRRLDGPR